MELDNFANFERSRRSNFKASLPKRIALPRSIKNRLRKKKKRKWFADRRKWRKKYDAYLRSEAWRAKRQQRLDFCNGICEYCRIAPAEQVHHLTYERIFNENLDDLRGICILCHEKLHPGKKFKKFGRRRRGRIGGTKEVRF